MYCSPFLLVKGNTHTAESLCFRVVTRQKSSTWQLWLFLISPEEICKLMHFNLEQCLLNQLSITASIRNQESSSTEVSSSKPGQHSPSLDVFKLEPGQQLVFIYKITTKSCISYSPPRKNQTSRELAATSTPYSVTETWFSYFAMLLTRTIT